MKTPKVIDATTMDMDSLKERLRSRCLEDADYESLLALIESFVWLGVAFENKCVSVKRLLKAMFGPRSEKSKDILNSDSQNESIDSGSEDGSSGGGPNEASGKDKERSKGHGRRKSSDYPNAQHIPVPHDQFKVGDLCPHCKDGALYAQPSGKVLRFRAQPPIIVEVWEPARLRCGMCNDVFTAPLPPEAGDKKYDETVGSMAAVLKYGTGMPFNRMGKLQDQLGIPFPPSVQYQIVAGVADTAAPVYEQLLLDAAQADLFHNDDTPMRILAYMSKGEVKEVDGRTGVFTTGVIAVKGEQQIALFFTGRNHAGENLAKVLKERDSESPIPIQMCDALSRNLPEGFTVKLANCNSHGRRQFVDLLDVFPEECRFVINTYKEIYKHEAEAKELQLDAAERLAYHQKHSGPLMEKMREYHIALLDEKRVEPNSTLGEAIHYMLNHWEELTLFLKIPGVPLDNNVLERLLKVAILNRKNAYFYKTERGAAVGDILMSLISTCSLNGENPFDYLTELQRHSAQISANPQDWMPWNFRATLERMEAGNTS